MDNKPRNIRANRVGNIKSETAIVVASFGTSDKTGRERSLDRFEKNMGQAFPGVKVLPTFTSPTVRRILKERDNEIVLDPDEALDELKRQGYKNVIIVPFLMIPGTVYEGIKAAMDRHLEDFKNIFITDALLSCKEGFDFVVDEIHNLVRKGTRSCRNFILMAGHGSKHKNNRLYDKINEALRKKGDTNVFVGLLEGEPSFDKALHKILVGRYEVVTLFPLMMVAGEHARNDIAGEGKDSWESSLRDMGYNTVSKLIGLGEFPSYREIFIKMAKQKYDLLFND